MQENENQDVDDRQSGSGQGTSSGTPQLSPKLRDKINKLAEWRIDPSSIAFPKDTREFRGGHATVARATLGVVLNLCSREIAIGTDVAIKKLKIENQDDRQRVLGLALREAGFLVEQNHTNIIKLEGFVEDLPNDRIWLIFPWEEHGNLKDFAAARDWEIPERISLINDVATGVEYLHSRNPPICHGDLKSVNVVVNRKCRAIITDFGSARRLSTKARAPNTQTNQSENGALPELVLETTICETTNTITLTGNNYTLRWAAPELLMDDEPGLWSDMWSLGWICYEVMTNSIPFEHVKKDSIVIRHVIRGDLPSVSNHTRIALVRALHLLMTECWSIDPSKRPSAEDCRSSMNRMPKIIPERPQTSDNGVLECRSLRRLVAQGAIHMRNDYDKAASLLTEALITSTKTGDNKVKVLALQSLAEMHMLHKKYNDAASCYSEVLKILSDKEERWKALMGLADALRSLKEYSKAVTSYSEAMKLYTNSENIKRRSDALLGLVEVYRAQGNREGIAADALLELAEVHRLQSNYSNAVPLYSEALTIYTGTASIIGRSNALLGLVEAQLIQRNYSEAVPLSSEVLEIYPSITDNTTRAKALLALGRSHGARGNRQEWADVLLKLAEVHRIQRNYSEADALYSEALAIYIDTANSKGRADTLFGLAEVHRTQRNYSEADALYSEALAIYTDTANSKGRADALFGLAELQGAQGNRYGGADILLKLAEVHRIQRNYSEADALYSKALAIYIDIANGRGRLNALFRIIEVHRTQRNHSDAVSLYSEALEIYKTKNNIGIAKALLGLAKLHGAQGNRQGRADALLELAEIHRTQRNYSKADPLYTEALAIYTDTANSKGRADALFGLSSDSHQQNPSNLTRSDQGKSDTARQFGQIRSTPLLF